MLIVPINFYDCIPLLLTLTLPGAKKVSTKQNLLASFSRILLIWSGWNLVWRWSNSSWTSWDYFWVRFVERREIAVVLTASNNFNVGIHWNVYELIWFKLGMMIDTFCTLHLDASVVDLDLDSRSQEYEKAEGSAPIISQCSLLIWKEFGILLRCNELHTHFMLSIQHSWKRPLKIWFHLEKTLILACVQTLTDLSLSNLVWW